MKTRYPIVHVVWYDAFSRDAWKGISEIKTTTPAVIDTVGYLIRKDKKFIAVSHSVANEEESDREDEACCTIFIPRGMIRSMKVLHP